ncbi:MAG: acylneuraminate cytidylyltransferase family protein [Bacteroidetes bacterium]|nr:acylneuraminate cytidylyltransferase family protein [Bacteroidota bacterium]
MKVLGIIPARGGSKGVPRKNIKLLGGKPLIAYTLDAVLKSNILHHVVSTDDEEIAEISKNFGGNVPFIRPPEIATDTASSLDVAIHALNMMEHINNIKYDAIMLLQPTTPFRNENDINQSIIIMDDSDADSVISVVDVGGTHPARMKFVRDGYLIDPDFVEEREGQNRQELEPMYIRNGGIYLSKKNVLMSGSFKGKNSKAYIMPEERSVNIDTFTDFEYAEWILSKKQK